jgi:phosphomannomutase
MELDDLKTRLAGVGELIRDRIGVRHTDVRLLALVGILGLALVVVGLLSWVRDNIESGRSEDILAQAAVVTGQIQAECDAIHALVTDREIQGLAIAALDNEGALETLKETLRGRSSQVRDARVYGPNLIELDAGSLGPNGFAVLDTLFEASETGRAPLQLHGADSDRELVSTVRLESAAGAVGFLVVTMDATEVLSSFAPGEPEGGYLAFKQFNGRQGMTELAVVGDVALAGQFPEASFVSGTLFRVVMPQLHTTVLLTAGQRWLMIIIGALMLVATRYLFRLNKEWAAMKEQERRQQKADSDARWKALAQEGEAGEDRPALASRPADTGRYIPDADIEPADKPLREIKPKDSEPGDKPGDIQSGEIKPAADAARGREEQESRRQKSVTKDESAGPAHAAPSGERPGKPSGADTSKTALDIDPPPMRMSYGGERRRKRRSADGPIVELTPGIFRAYDIRGIVGKTLDAGVAAKVGQVLGSMVLERNAGPVVIGRDGRLSGPDLVAGMTDGILSTGCDVLDIGAVPTGVLYYAAHELAAGSGVVITGSHNPPDYNGFKIMVAGQTLFGEQIGGIYERIQKGDVRVGKGTVTQTDVLEQYKERIVSDIRLERPLRVVIDCGNGIGGICAADVLQAVGAEVFPLYDEVDGHFPNHHPDPSDPENLRDLIDSVRMLNADIGLALDGDADRLGVVTLGGSIIYPDRIMMLLALDVLDRVPGATIIYDVKCTNHLPQVIKEAGGKPVMYKTGHSLIKAKMKEIGSPFAGEMSGHFFFGERWYGVDDGIYAACRLLEILAGTDTPPEAILNSLPTSYSTPELKVEMEEGANHDFVAIFQHQARFEGARISTIDGLRADFDFGWGLVRASNTTPILVVRFDADTEEDLKHIKTVFRQQMLAIDATLDLPF